MNEKDGVSMEIIKNWTVGADTYSFVREFTSMGHYNFFLKDNKGTAIAVAVYVTLDGKTKSGLDFDLLVDPEVITKKQFLLSGRVLRDLQQIVWNIDVYHSLISEEEVEVILNEGRRKDF